MPNWKGYASTEDRSMQFQEELKNQEPRNARLKPGKSLEKAGEEEGIREPTWERGQQEYVPITMSSRSTKAWLGSDTEPAPPACLTEPDQQAGCTRRDDDDEQALGWGCLLGVAQKHSARVGEGGQG
jgi:hypothetical protein